VLHHDTRKARKQLNNIIKEFPTVSKKAHKIQIKGMVELTCLDTDRELLPNLPGNKVLKINAS